MKKRTVVIIAVVAVALLIIFGIIGSYNGLVEEQQEVEASWSSVSIQLQRRADLIPNLVNTVKGYTDYEQNTLTAVTEAPIPTPIRGFEDVLLNNFFNPVFANFSILSDNNLNANTKAPIPPSNNNTWVTISSVVGSVVASVKGSV